MKCKACGSTHVKTEEFNESYHMCQTCGAEYTVLNESVRMLESSSYKKFAASVLTGLTENLSTNALLAGVKELFENYVKRDIDGVEELKEGLVELANSLYEQVEQGIREKGELAAILEAANMYEDFYNMNVAPTDPLADVSAQVAPVISPVPSDFNPMDPAFGNPNEVQEHNAIDGLKNAIGALQVAVDAYQSSEGLENAPGQPVSDPSHEAEEQVIIRNLQSGVNTLKTALDSLMSSEDQAHGHVKAAFQPVCDKFTDYGSVLGLEEGAMDKFKTSEAASELAFASQHALKECGLDEDAILGPNPGIALNKAHAISTAELTPAEKTLESALPPGVPSADDLAALDKEHEKEPPQTIPVPKAPKDEVPFEEKVSNGRYAYGVNDEVMYEDEKWNIAKISGGQLMLENEKGETITVPPYQVSLFEGNGTDVKYERNNEIVSNLSDAWQKIEEKVNNTAEIKELRTYDLRESAAAVADHPPLDIFTKELGDANGSNEIDDVSSKLFSNSKIARALKLALDKHDEDTFHEIVGEFGYPLWDTSRDVIDTGKTWENEILPAVIDSLKSKIQSNYNDITEDFNKEGDLSKNDHYKNLAFLQGEASNDALSILDAQGEKAAIEFMKSMSDENQGETSKTAFRGTNDHTYEDGEYVLSWNSKTPYIGLEKHVVVGNPTPETSKSTEVESKPEEPKKDEPAMEEEIEKIEEGQYLERGLHDAPIPYTEDPTLSSVDDNRSKDINQKRALSAWAGDASADGEGGGEAMSESNEFKEGDVVCFDTIRNQEWIVESVKGDFLTAYQGKKKRTVDTSKVIVEHISGVEVHRERFVDDVAASRRIYEAMEVEQDEDKGLKNKNHPYLKENLESPAYSVESKTKVLAEKNQIFANIKNNALHKEDKVTVLQELMSMYENAIEEVEQVFEDAVSSEHDEAINGAYNYEECDGTNTFARDSQINAAYAAIEETAKKSDEEGSAQSVRFRGISL